LINGRFFKNVNRAAALAVRPENSGCVFEVKDSCQRAVSC